MILHLRILDFKEANQIVIGSAVEPLLDPENPIRFPISPRKPEAARKGQIKKWAARSLIYSGGILDSARLYSHVRPKSNWEMY